MPENKIKRARRLRRDQTEAERKLWARLRNRQLDGWKFKRQVPKGAYIVDFLCAEASLIVELDGSQHAEEHAMAYDTKRTKYLQEGGYRVLRFWNYKVFEDIDHVVALIWQKLQEPPLQDCTEHSLSPTGRGLA